MPQAIQRDIESSSVPDISMAFMLGVELKNPLIALKLAAERAGNETSVRQAEQALRTIDSVMLYQRLQASQQQLALEPIHIGSVMTDVLGTMQTHLDSLGYESEIHMQHGITTVDADKNALRTGLECMLEAMLSAAHRPSPITWHVFKAKDGIRISMTNNSVDVAGLTMPSIDQLHGSTQPVQGLAVAATHLVTAQGIFGALGGTMRKVRRSGGKMQGFGVTLRASQQMTLV
jgi:hypothetical protein